MEFYLHWKYDRDGVDLYMQAEIDGHIHVSVSYGDDAYIYKNCSISRRK